MQITEKTLFKEEIYSLIKQADKERIKETAINEILGGPFWDIELGVFMQFLNGDYSVTKIEENIKNAGGLTIFAHVFFSALADFIVEFSEKYKNLTPAPKKEEVSANRDCLSVTFSENLLFFTRSYFGLHSFRACESIKVSEIIIAKKEAYNTIVFQRRFSEIEMEKLKIRKK